MIHRMAKLAYRSLTCGAAALATTLALSACGGTTHHLVTQSASVGAAKPAAIPTIAPVSEPNAVVARVGGYAITRAQFVPRMLAQKKSTGPYAPVPPDFTACIAHLKATAAATGESASKSSLANLTTQCRGEYEGLEQNALEPLITDQWVIGGAAEEGVAVSQREVEAEIKNDEKGQSQEVARELAATGRTAADWALEMRAFLLGEKIRDVFIKQTSHVSQAQIARYYDEHESLYEVPESRELEIVHANGKSEALKAKKELAGGESFATVAKTLPEPALFSKAGVIAAYEPDLYHQAPLNNAILAAKPNVLSGPVRIFLGYYVFEVKRIVPAVVKPLAQVEDTIRQALPKLLYKRAFAAWVKSWRRRWVARTDCRPGFVVVNCRQFGPPLEEDPYTLN
jgi:foldase protein PrsA